MNALRIPGTRSAVLALFACTVWFVAAGAPLSAANVCGNGAIEPPETCDDGNTIPGDDCSAYCLVEEENCLNDFADFNNPTCTANDVVIALILNESQITCELGTLIELDLLAQFQAGSDERYDISSWIGQDAGDAKFGTCVHTLLEPTTNSFAQVCSISRAACDADSDCTIVGEQCLDTGYFPGGPFPPYDCDNPFDAGNGNFYCPGINYHNEDPPPQTDFCADIQQNVDTYQALGVVTVPCVDTDEDGKIDIPTCVSWENNANAAACVTVDDAIPGTPSKCRCEVQNVGNVFIAGRIVVVKETDPAGDPAEFAIDISENTSPTPTILRSFMLSDGESGSEGNLLPTALGGNTYSVAEDVPAGWALTGVSCESDDPDTTVPNETAIVLHSGETVTCTFSNQKDSRIIVDKVTFPPGDPQSFAFDAGGGTYADFSLTDAAAPNNQQLDPGTYSVSETVPAGWDLTSSTCSDGSAPGSISLAAGETVTCTFTNTKRGRIIVDKVTFPPGDPQSFAFDAGGGTYADFSLTDAAAPNNQQLVPGTYSVSETVPAGWDLTSSTCSDGSAPASIGLAAGETVTCTFTNTKRGRIIVDKVTFPPGDPQSFAFDAGGGTYADFSLTDAAAPNNQQLVPGTYSVSETVPADWDLTSATCSDGSAPASIGLAAGETVTCTFTNTKRGRIIVDKVTFPPGDPQSFAFDAGGGTYADFSLTDAAAPNNQQLVPGTYSVSETVPADWDLTSATCSDGSAPASIGLAAGETVTCTFTNTKRGRIIVDKVTFPPGDPQSFAFDAGGGTYADFSLTDAAAPNNQQLVPGTYSVSETVPAGWDLTSATCSDGSAPASIGLAAGETVTCTFTNTKRGRIIVDKVTLPTGSLQSFAFDAGGGTYADFSLTDAAAPNNQQLVPGNYSVSETVPVGWDLISATCSDGSAPGNIGLAAGETVTCTFTNRQDASLTVFKHTVPAGDGTLFEFLSSFGPFTLGDGASIPFININPGTYSVSENNLPPLWDLIDVFCTDGSGLAAIILDPGEHVDCHLTNRKRGTVTLLKTESGGLPLSHPYDFEIREGASETAEGTVLANGSADVDTGEVVFSCAGVPLADCVNFLGVARFPPGDYQLCETGMMPGWHNTLDGFTPLGATPEGGDNSTECVNFTLDAGELEDFGTIDNVPPPGGDARTIGFWKNWSSCDGHGNQAPVLDEMLGDGIFLWSGFLVDSCQEAVDLLDKRRISNPDVVSDGPKVAGDAAYSMSAQLMAVLLNFEAEAGTCPAILSAVTDAQALLQRIGFTGGTSGDANLSYLPSNPSQSDLIGDVDPAGNTFTKAKLKALRESATTLNGILDDYNNNELCP